jgi:hypothetical protein
MRSIPAGALFGLLGKGILHRDVGAAEVSGARARMIYLEGERARVRDRGWIGCDAMGDGVDGEEGESRAKSGIARGPQKRNGTRFIGR